MRVRSLVLPAVLALAGAAHAQHLVQEVAQSVNALEPGWRSRLSPDGRWLVTSLSSLPTRARVTDLTGVLPTVVHTQTPTGSSASVRTPVLVTDTRAAVLGERLSILDLTQGGAPVLAEHAVGNWAHDMAVTPDGALLVVRGGAGFGPGTGVQAFDLASGAAVGQWNSAWFPSDTLSPPTHSVVADDRHVLALLPDLGSSLSVSLGVLDRQAPGGLGWSVVGLVGGHPHDLQLSPDGQHALLRSRYEMQWVELDGANSQALAATQVVSQVGGLFLERPTAVTDTHAVALGVALNAPAPSCAVHALDLDGRSGRVVLPGWALEVDVTPDGSTAFVLTTDVLAQIALGVLGQPGPALQLVDSVPVDLDDALVHALGQDHLLAVGDGHVVASVGGLNSTHTTRAFSFDAAGLALTWERIAPTPLLDVRVERGGSRAVLAWEGHLEVVDLVLGTGLLQHTGGAPAPSPGSAIAAEVLGAVTLAPGRAVVNGVYPDPVSGYRTWVAEVDLFEQPSELCGGAANSTGGPGHLVLSGSARASANDLVLWATDVPANTFGTFLYGDQAVSVPFGDGTRCVGGNAVRFPPAGTGSGTVSLAVDANSLPPGGGALLAGTTWHFQYAYRDSALPGGAGFNATSATTVTFEP